MLHTVIQSVIDMLFHAKPLLIYGVVALFLLLESCGVPIINSTLLLLTGALVSLGHLQFWPLAGAAIAGSIAGACLAYWIGERGGRPALLRLLRLLHIDERKVLIAERWFQRTGAWMIFLSRITPYIRPFACFVAGISRLAYRRFLLAAVCGSLLWCLTLILVGMLLGRHWRWGVALIERYTLPVCLVLILLVVLSLLLGRGLRRRLRKSFLDEEGAADKEERHFLSVL